MLVNYVPDCAPVTASTPTTSGTCRSGGRWPVRTVPLRQVVSGFTTEWDDGIMLKEVVHIGFLATRAQLLTCNGDYRLPWPCCDRTRSLFGRMRQ